MKKHRIKKYLQLGIFLFGVLLLLINCNKDILVDEETIQQDFSKLTVKIIDLSEVEKNSKVYGKIKPIIESSKSVKNSRDTIVSNEYGFFIDTDKVKYVENGDYHSYNFEIFRDNPEDDNLENLFMSLNEDGGYDSFIVKYDFVGEELSGMTEEELSSRTTQYIPIDFDSSFLSSRRDVDIVCVETWLWTCSDCDDPENATFSWVLYSTECTSIGGGGPGPGPSTSGDSSGNDTSSGNNTTGGNQGGGSPPSGNNSTGTYTYTYYSAPNCVDCPEFEDDSPCKQLKGNSRDTNFITNMTDLETKSTTLDKEAGYIQKPNSAGAGSDYDYVEGDSNTGMIVWDIPNTTTVKGMSHTHYDIENHLPVFSADDLYALFSIFGPEFDTSGNVTFENPHDIGTDFTYILITAHGTKLALKFDDENSIEKLRLFGEKYFGDWDIAVPPAILGVEPEETDRQKLLKKYDKYVKSKFSIEKQKKKFARFLDKNNLGLSLYQANNDFTQWEKINKSGNPTPCN